VPQRRVAVLGLDAAEWRLIEPMLGRGEMPHLARIRARGVAGPLVQPAPLTERPWDTFLTGREAPLEATGFDPSTYEPFIRGPVDRAPFYAGLPGRSLILDVPYMSVAPAVEGALVAGWGEHYSGRALTCHPSWLGAEIERRFGEHPARAIQASRRWHDPAYLRRLTTALVEGALRRVDIAAWLMAQMPDWSLFVTVWTEAHSAGEVMWHGIDAHPGASPDASREAGKQLRCVYRALDAAVGRLAARLPPETHLVVCSVHGTRRNDGDVPSSVLLPELLCRLYAGRRLLRGPNPAVWRLHRCPVIGLPPSRSWADAVRDAYPAATSRDWLARRAPGSLRKLISTGQRLAAPLLRPRRAGADNATGLIENRLRRRLANRLPPSRYRPFWPCMEAFALPTYSLGRVRINLRGRERNGVVSPQRYTATCDEIETTLRACRNPRTGQPIVLDVARVRAPAPLDPDGPSADLVVTWTDCADALEHPVAGVVGPFPYGRTGAHAPGGFLLAAGPSIAVSSSGARPAAILTPTILQLLGQVAGRGSDQSTSVI
jgi:predicted AlkP superfamily phosphohydrolase/phosphomutase